MQAEAQTNPLLNIDNNEAIDKADVAQLREQMHTLTQAQKDNQDTLRLILEQLATLAIVQIAQQNTIYSIEQDNTLNPLIIGLQNRTLRYSKKQPNLNPLSNRTNSTFESQKLQIQRKFQVNANYFKDEEAKMLYLFNCTTRDV